jgi:tetratricopeptide (TPR) repeat protein
LKPDAGAVHRLLGHIYAEQGQFDQALSELQLAIKYSPNDMFNYKSRALIYSETKRDKEALADYEKFVSMRGPNERNMKVIELGAMIYTRGGQDAKAIALYDELYEKTHSTTYLVDKAKCLARLGKEKEAIDTYSQVIKMTDANEIACFERGKLEAKAGRNQQALDDFTNALKQVHTASIYLERAKLLEKMGRPELAKKDRESAKEDRLDW